MTRIAKYSLCFTALVLFGCDTDETTSPCSPGCTGNTVCQAGQCVPVDTPSEPVTPGGEGAICGASVCEAGELCMNGQCFKRDNKAVEGVACNAQSFVESCDGNSLVYCDCDESGNCLTAVAPCSSGETCALMADKNFGMCAISDAKCAQSGVFTRCFDLIGGISYIEYYACALATDGRYYPFRDGIETADCIGACVDSYRCNLNEEVCGDSFVESCEGNIMTYCADGKVFRMNCEDYGTTCVMDGGTADCAWE